MLQEQARDTVRYLTEQFLTSNKVYVAGMSIHELTNRLYRDMAGYSILEEPLADPNVEEILVNAYNDVEIIDEKGRHKYHESFATPEQGRLVRISGQTIDTAHPIVDAYITTGVRITAFFPPVIDEKDGIAFTIRKQHLFNVTRDQLIRWGTANEELLGFISLCLNHGVSVSVAGKTGSGKTTLTSYLLNNLDEKLRIVTIEETREILIVNPLDENNQKLKSVVTLCTRPSDDPRLDVNMQSLVRSTLRMRPDIITMAEMRGGEAYDAQEAARTGHTVTNTLHANSARQTYSRILTMCQMNPGQLPSFRANENAGNDRRFHDEPVLRHPDGPDRRGVSHHHLLQAAFRQQAVHHGGRGSLLLLRRGRQDPNAIPIRKDQERRQLEARRGHIVPHCRADAEQRGGRKTGRLFQP